MNLGRLIATLGVETSGLKEAAKEMKNLEAEANRSVRSINDSLATIGDNASRVGRTMSLVLTVPLTAIAVGAFKLSKDFETTMAQITGLVGIARDQVDDWAGSLRRMAPDLATAPQELISALYFVTSAGIKGAEALDVVTESAKAARAGLGETMVVADLVTSAMNAYGKEVLSATDALDVLVATVREGKAEAPALAASLGQVLPIASEMQVSFSEVGAAVASMTRTGTNAATAAMQLKNIMAGFLKPASDAQKALIEMGTSAAEFRRIIREDGLLAALTKLKELHDEYGETTISRVIPNLRAMVGVFDLVGANLNDNIKIFEAMRDNTGDLQNAWEAVSDTAEQRLNAALAASKNAMIALGNTISTSVTPIIEAYGRAVSGLAEWYEGLSEASRKTIVVVGALVASLGPLLITIGMLATHVVPGLITTVRFLSSTVIPQLIARIRLLYAVISAHPVAAMVTALGLVVAGMINFKKAVDSATIAQDRFNNIIDTGKVSHEETRGEIDKNIQVIKTLESTVYAQVRAWRELKSTLPEVFDALNMYDLRAGRVKDLNLKINVALEIQELERYRKEYDNTVLIVERLRAKVEELSGADFGIYGFTELIRARREMEAMEGVAAKLRDTILDIQGLQIEAHIDSQPLQYQINLLESRKKILTDQRAAIAGSALKTESLVQGWQAFASALKDTPQDDMRKLSSEIANIDKQIRALRTQGVVMPEVEMVTAFDTSDIISKLQDGKRFIDQMSSAMGDLGIEYDVVAERQSLFSAVLEELLKNVNASHPAVRALIKEWSGIIPEVSEIDRVMTELSDTMCEANIMADVLGDRYDFLHVAITAHTAAMEQLARKGLDTGEAFAMLSGELLSLYDRANPTVTVMGTLGEALAKTAVEESLLGDRFDAGAARMRSYSTAVDGLIIEYQRLAEVGEDTSGVLSNINEILRRSDAIRAESSFTTLQRSLAETALRAELLGDSYDGLGTQLRAYETYLDSLITSSTASRKELEETARTISLLRDAMKEVETGDWLAGFKNQVQQYHMAIGSIASSMYDLYNAKHATELSKIDQVAERERKSAEWVAEQKARIDREYARKQQRIALAMAAIDVASGIIKAIPNPFLMAFAAAAGAVQIAAIKAQKFAKGGIVPAGYPGDTYPALLSSHEAVIPLDRLHEVAPRRGGSGGKIEIKLRVEGRDLVGVIDEMDLIQTTY